MKTNLLIRWLLILAIFTLILSACKPVENNVPQPTTLSQKLLTGSNLSLLRAAITRAGLDASLGQAGAITLFAPSDSAFIGAGYADVNAINAIPVDTLKRLLQYHILNTKLLSLSIAVGSINVPQQTLAGLPIYLTKTTTTTVSSSSSTTAVSTITARTSVNGARLVQTDVEGTNGVIHVIDKVLLPPTGDIVQTLTRLSAKGPDSFSLLTAAITRANLADLLQGRTINQGPFTLFAPVDAGFTTAYSSVSAINAAPVTKVASLINAHILLGQFFSTNLYPGRTYGTITGEYALSPLLDAKNRLNSIYISSRTDAPSPTKVTDIVATNGVIHVVSSAFRLSQ